MSISAITKSIFAVSALISAVFVSLHLQAEQKFHIYDLQERCGQLSAVFWDKKAEKGTYQSHYNPSVNRCILFQKEISFKANSKSVVSKKLYDINENKLLANFSQDYEQPAPTACEVLGNKCTSEDEWTDLTKKFVSEKE